MRQAISSPLLNIRECLAHAAARCPHATALESATEQYSYAALHNAVSEKAATWQRAGLGAGDRIAIAASRTPDTIIAILAALELGAAYIPLDLSYPADRLKAMLEDARARVIVGEPSALEQLAGLVGSFPMLGQLAAPAPREADGDLVYVLFTSGSTGRPKGVAMDRTPLDHLIAWHVSHTRLGQPARTLQFAPLSFDVHHQEILSSIATGGTLVLISDGERRDPTALRQVLAQRQVDRLYLPYVALQMLAQADAEAPANAPTLKLRDVVSAGEQLQITPDIRALFTRQPGAVLHNHYGPTETHVVTAHELDGEPSSWPQIPPIGQPLPYVQILLREPTAVEVDTTPEGEATGELLLGGDCLAQGYLGRPDLTAERFITLPEGRFYVTGDLVTRDAQGVLTYLGRADQQLKVDGFRIEPSDIELALMAHEAVQTAVVAAPEMAGGGKILTAYIILRGDHDAAALPNQWREWLRSRLPEYMIPVRFMIVASLPTTPSGKIDRRNLPQLTTGADAAAKPSGALTVEQAIKQIWGELLGLSQIDGQANVFELGAKSLLVLRFVAGMKALGHRVSVAQVYDQPTPDGLAAALSGPSGAASGAGQKSRKGRASGQAQQDLGGGIAIVGMAVRTAGAKDLDTFWQNLLDGKEGIQHFRPEELDPSTPLEIRSRPNFVPARGVLEDVDRFDAAFFGVPAREATVLDPQQRLFLELCWTALEHASMDPGQSHDRFGVYAGNANNGYTAALRHAQPELVQQFGEFGVMLGAEKDYIATRVANRLNLNGPALSIHTACSTSLVAITQAWHGLATGQCDVALAGGMTVAVPQKTGYLHVEGGMESADGHCRPFDEQATGTVFASGGGVVVLKRLADALADGDTVYAVIKGVGINNDGGNKASFTAPSVTGQAQAIRMALDHAGVDARSIGYVEAHGTGTSLGDPIEVAALTQAWATDTSDRQFCQLGSVKGHLGHMVAAAGVIGLIKTTLALHRQLIPGTLHYQHPNPNIDFASSPFHVSGQATAWPRSEVVRRAGVSSFGVGGTNAHVIVEESPQPVAAPVPASAGGPVVLPLSAKSPDALARRMRDLAQHIQHAAPGLDSHAMLATLTRGRQPMAHRHVVVAPSLLEAAGQLAQLAQREPVGSGRVALKQPRVVYLFPGQGSQHPGMARGLYDALPAFKAALDECIAIAQPLLPDVNGAPADLLAWLLHDDPKDARVGALLAQTRFAQPALFCVSYALTTWLDSLGVQPAAMIGHSIGEYAAACRANVMSLTDAIRAVVARGHAMYDQVPGAMLAVRCGVDQLQPLLLPGAEIAAQNAPALTVVAGSAETIDALTAKLEGQDIGTTRLRVSHAFHSQSMDPALPRVAQALQQAALQPPALAVYSCVSGALLTAQDATDPAYWARQVRAGVRFMQAVEAEMSVKDTVFVEVGAGQALTALLRQYRSADGKPATVVPMMNAPTQAGAPEVFTLQAFGQLWSLGVSVSWPVSASARRATLPTYPFQGERYWFQQPAASPAKTATVPLASLESPIPPGPSIMSRTPRIQEEVVRIMGDVSGLTPDTFAAEGTFVDMGLDSLSMTQAALEFERVFGVKVRLRRLMEDLDNVAKLTAFLDGEMPADKFAPPPAAIPPSAPTGALNPAMGMSAPMSFTPMTALHPAAGGSAVHQVIQQQMQLMAQQLALLSGQAPQAAMMPGAEAVPLQRPAASAVTAITATAAASAEASTPGSRALVEKPFGASARIVLDKQQNFTPTQQAWIDDFIQRYNQRTGSSKTFSQTHRKVMSDPRVVTGFNPLWKDLVYPIVANRSKGARVWDIDGNEYIDLLSCFGGNLLGYQPESVVKAMHEQLEAGIEVGPQHPLAADVAKLISEFTNMERVAFCNTGSEAVMGAMRIARTVTGRKKIAIFNNSYHGIFDEVIVRGTKQLRSLSAAPGILANAVENILVLDWDSEDSLRILREQGPELAAIMTEPIQNKYPTIQPRAFIRSLREIADAAGCALIFDEVVTGFRVAPGGAQEFYGVKSDISTYGKIIGGGLPFAAIAGGSHWLDALDGGHWQYGDDSYPEAGVTYFAGTFVRHPLALAAAKATLTHLKQGGKALYQTLADRTQYIADRLNEGFAVRGAPVKAVHCASLWRLAWDDHQKNISLFYYLARFNGLHLYEQFGHFVTEAMGDAECKRIVDVFLGCLDELMALGFIAPRAGTPPSSPPSGPGPGEKKALPNDAPAALSPGQTERWLAASFDANARRALNESFCLSLEGAVNETALEQALHDVLKRHEAFRICFDEFEPRQILNADADLHIHHVDLRDQADSASALDAFCAKASVQDFVLTQAPLARVSLLKLADRRTVVHLVVSHLIFDGWASTVLLNDLAQAYQARVQGREPQWAPAESPRAFGEAEHARWEGPEAKEAMAFWTRTLAQPPESLSLGDKQPPSPRQFTGDTIKARFDGPLLQALQARGKQSRATLFQVMLAAVAMLVQRRTGREDMVLSIPYASQSLAQHGPLIADGVLDMPLRLTCQAQDTLDTIAAQVKTRLLDALEYPLATQGSVARALGRPSSGDRPPLTGVFFNFNPRVDVSGFAPLKAEMVEPRKLGLLGEVIFNFYDNGDALTLDLHHSTEFFSPAHAQGLVDDLSRLLHEVCGLTPVKVEPLVHGLSPQHWALLESFNATRTEYETDLRLGDLIRRSVQQTPNAIAVRFEDRSVTYAELDSMAWALTDTLRSQGVQPGTLVGVCLDRSVELVAALVGVVYSGGAYVPLDPAYPHDRLRNMCEDASMRIVVTAQREWAKTRTAFPADVKTVYMEDLVNAAPQGQHALTGTPEDPAYVIFTSGSTGRPKGAMNAHVGIVNRLQWMQQQYQLGGHDKVIQKTPYSFDVSVWEFFWPLMTGATIVVAKPDGHRDAAYLADLIQREQVTFLHFVPSMLRLFMEEPGLHKLTSIRHVVCSGEALPIDAVDRFFELLPHARLDNLYGPTEAAVDVTYWPCRAKDPLGIVPIGFPVANTRMYVLDEQLRLLPPGAEGELYIGGVQVGMGYVARPDLTAERFLPDPYNPGGRMYKTGDVGRWLPSGAIEYMGRADHQIKLRGNRIELGEIEAQLMAMPGMARCVVVAKEFSPGDARLVAYLVTKDKAKAPSLADVKAHLGAKLPEYMLPQHVMAMDDIPLLPNGKIDRKALPMPTEQQAASSAGYRAPSSELEQTIARAMQDMLKIQRVGLDDDFFSLGGHSLLAARVIGQINKQLGTQLTLRSMFESPTVAKLASVIDAQRNGGASAQPERAPIVHQADQTWAPLTLMQERIRFIEEMQPGRVVYNAPSAHRFTGAMNLEAFDKAFQAMVQRQPALRTAIIRQGDQYIQKVFDEVQVSLLPLEDLSTLTKEQREATLAQRLEALTAETFDLAKPPLLKIRLFKLAEQEHALFFMTHHILWDGWSFDILYTEISALYEAFVAGKAPDLAPLSLTFNDYAHWHNAWLETDELKAQVAFWTKQFADGDMPKAPVGDVPRQYAAGGKGSTSWMHLDEALVEQTRDLAKQTGSTVSIVMMSVYAALMSQWLDDKRPAIGMPFRGRSTPELEAIMGFFNNMLPIRLEVSTDIPFLDWIKQVRQTMVAAFASQDAPFELLARDVDGQRGGVANRLYQVMFSFQDARQRQTQWGPLAHERIPLLQKGATEDLNLWMVEIPGGIEGGLQYNAELFLPDTIDALRDRFTAMLRAVIQSPQQTVATLLQPTPNELQRLASWQQTALTGTPTKRVMAAIEACAAQAPASVAMRVGDQALSMADLVACLRQATPLIKNALPAQGSGTVAIFVPNAASAALCGLMALNAGANILLLPAAPTADAMQALRTRGDVKAIVAAQEPELTVQSGITWIDPRGLATSASAWALALPASSSEGLAQLDIPNAIALQPQAFDMLCASLTALVRPLTSDTSLTVLESGREAVALLLAAHAWSAGACWRPLPEQDAQGDATDWADIVRKERPGVIHLPGAAWHDLMSIGELGTIAPTLIVEVQDTRPTTIERLTHAHCGIVSMYVEPSGLPLAGGLVARPQDSGLCGHPWAANMLGIVDERGVPVPASVIGNVHVQGGARASKHLMRWRADGTLHFLGEQGQEMDELRAPPKLTLAPKSLGKATTPTEQAIVEIWTTLLGIPGIGPDDNFFDLGGTSLQAMQAMARLEAQLGHRISAQRMVFDTLQQLAKAYDNSAGNLELGKETNAAILQGTTEAAQPDGLFKRLSKLVKRA